LETGLVEALKTFGGFGVVGAVAIILMVLCAFLYREVKEVRAAWMADRQATSDKRIDELRLQTGVIERNTAAHMEATKTNEGRASILQRLVDDHGDHKNRLEGMQGSLSEIKALLHDIKRRGDQ
jgi:hypothetical protein